MRWQSSKASGLIIRGGTVVLESEIIQADVVIDGGHVAALTAPGHAPSDGELALEASGALVLPGAVDIHTHVGLSFGEFTTRDDFASATRAAALGGTTTILEFAIPSEDETPMQAVEHRMESASGVSSIDYGFHACVARSAKESLPDIERAAKIGVPSVKVFTAYRGIVMLEPDEIQAVMEAAARLGSIVLVHAETETIVEKATADLAATSSLHSRNHPRARPPEAELDAARSVLSLAEATGCTVYLVHVTLPEVADEISRARERGVAAFGESCPHYLLLDESCYATEDPELYVCSPPLRPAGAVRELWARLGRELTGVNSDHCCFDASQKAVHADDLTRIPPGLPGIQTRLPVMLSEALEGRMSLTDLVGLCAARAARLFGIAGKGSLLPGYDADVLIVDPAGKTEVRNGLDMDSGYSPFDGRTLRGRVDTVISKGRVLVADGLWADAPARGSFLTRARRAGSQT